MQFLQKQMMIKLEYIGDPSLSKLGFSVTIVGAEILAMKLTIW